MPERRYAADQPSGDAAGPADPRRQRILHAFPAAEARQRRHASRLLAASGKYSPFHLSIDID